MSQLGGGIERPVATLVRSHAVEPPFEIRLIPPEKYPPQLCLDLRLRAVAGGGEGVERLNLVGREVERVSGAGSEIAVRLRRPVRVEHEPRKIGDRSRTVNLDRAVEVWVRLQIDRRSERLHHFRERLLDEKREANPELAF